METEKSGKAWREGWDGQLKEEARKVERSKECIREEI